MENKIFHSSKMYTQLTETGVLHDILIMPIFTKVHLCFKLTHIVLLYVERCEQ